MLSPQSQLPAQHGWKRGWEHGCLGGPWPLLQLGWGLPNQQPEAWAETGQRRRGRDRDGFSEGSEVCLWLQGGASKAGELRGRGSTGSKQMLGRRVPVPILAPPSYGPCDLCEPEFPQVKQSKVSCSRPLRLGNMSTQKC